MSANNFLRVVETKKKFKLYECCADVVDDETEDELKKYGCSLIETFDTVDGAIKGAQEYMSENIVEYGVDFIFEQK